MDELFIETKNGIVPISGEIASKYGLKKGSYSPFTGGRIVGKNGDISTKENTDKFSLQKGMSESHDDSITEFENGLFMSTSEIIDFSEGTDSSDEQ